MKRLAVLLAVAGCGCTSAFGDAKPTVRLVGPPGPALAGDVWAGTLATRGNGTPTLVARRGDRTVAARVTRSGDHRFRAYLQLREPGTWQLTATLRGRRFVLGLLRVSPYRLLQPGQLFALPDGDLLVAERGGKDRVLRVDPATGRFTEFAIDVVAPFGLARAADGSVYVSGEEGIFLIPAAGGIASEVTTAIASPIALGSNGELYYASGATLGRVDPHTGELRTYAVDVDVPHGLAVLPDGDLIVSDSGHKRLLRVDPATGKSSVLATGFRTPLGITLDTRYRILVVDYAAGTLLRVDDSGSITTLASGLEKPYAVAVTGDGTAYVVEAGELDRPSGKLVRVGPDGSVVPIPLLPA